MCSSFFFLLAAKNQLSLKAFLANNNLNPTNGRERAHWSVAAAAVAAAAGMRYKKNGMSERESQLAS